MVFSFFVVGRICWHWIKVLPASIRMMLPAFLVKMLPSLPENMMAVGSLIDTFLSTSILYTDLRSNFLQETCSSARGTPFE